MVKRRIVSLILAATMAVSLAACGGGSTDSGTDGGVPSGSTNDTLVVGYSPFNAKFSPFFAETDYDRDAELMTMELLLNSDRTGAIIYKGIEGETHEYNGTDYTYYGPADLEVTENNDGTVDYDFTLRDDITFSDGEKLTVDDVIFNFYVLADPTYDGYSTFYSMPVKGMEEYRSGMSTLFTLLVEAGEDNTDFTYWDEETQTKFWENYKLAGAAFAKEIVDYCVEEGLVDDDSDVSGAAAAWGFDVKKDADPYDFFAVMMDEYANDIASLSSTETAGSAFADLMEDYNEYQKGIETGKSADSISGIQKTGENGLRITSTQVDATLIYQLAIEIAPLHYYGSTDLYDYDNNKFGFEKGDLSLIRSKTTEPMGAGAYIFKKYENGVINYEANENYYLGAPKIKYMNFREVQDNDKLNGLINGEIDITDPSYSLDAVKAIEQENGGEVSGDKIVTETVDNLGYGYIGMNVKNVKVGDDPGSDESKNLRKAIATIVAVYRDEAIDSYYGDTASVINYPISNTSWAAPQPTDSDYKVAFSTDIDGNDIYTSDMSSDDKYAAAKEAALGFFEAAGYTVENGKLTAAPDGAKLEYEALIPADGTGDHPAFTLLTSASKAFEDIGLKLIVTDLSDSSELWDKLDAQQVDMWAAAWQATVDPDMYQIYYSDIANGGKNPGGSNYEYAIADAELDELIMEARTSTDQEYRKTVYKSCLDIIIDWACEIPNYQRQNAIIVSPERVNMDTFTKDITTFYKWYSDIKDIELK